MQTYSLVLMAAGMGSRYGGLKQLATFNGKTLLEYSIQDAYKTGCRHIIFVIGPAMESDFKKAITNKLPAGLKVDYAFQSIPKGRKKPYGTGEAVLQAKKFITGPFLVINADDYYGPKAFTLIADFFNKNTKDMCLVGYSLGNTLSHYGGVSRGICQTRKDGSIEYIQEHTNIQRHPNGLITCNSKIVLLEDTPVSMNCWGLRSDFLNYLQNDFEDFRSQNIKEEDEYYLPSAITRWIKNHKGKVHVLPTNEKWCGLTFPEDKTVVETHLKSIPESLKTNNT